MVEYTMMKQKKPANELHAIISIPVVNDFYFGDVGCSQNLARIAIHLLSSMPISGCHEGFSFLFAMLCTLLSRKALYMQLHLDIFTRAERKMKAKNGAELGQLLTRGS